MSGRGGRRLKLLDDTQSWMTFHEMESAGIITNEDGGLVSKISHTTEYSEMVMLIVNAHAFMYLCLHIVKI